MELIFSAPATPVVPVIGSTALFPVHRIYCVGRNYAEHSKEMGGTGREAPFFFMNPPMLPSRFQMEQWDRCHTLQKQVICIMKWNWLSPLVRGGEYFGPRRAAAHLGIRRWSRYDTS